jgi:ABC-type Mn2+/Zn2+ transport system permease subunit/Mn-dependent DtxR family transcriptional regulator
MSELVSLFSEVYVLRALVASSMVGLMCGVLGCFIVLRNMSLVGDALAHAILPGVVVAFMVVGNSAMGFFSGAVIAGLTTAAGITWIQQKVKTKNDAAVGIVFTSMFSIGVILISTISKNDGVHLDLKDFLFGSPLGVSNTDLVLTALVMTYVLISVAVFYRYLFASTFQDVVAQTMGISVKLMHYFLMLLLSFAVVASLQTVGVILVVAMLITPAATALLLAKRLKVVIGIAGVIGLLSANIGMAVSVIFDTPPGPAMALVATIIYLLAVVFSPRKGLVVQARNRYNRELQTEQEDILKQAFRMDQRGGISPQGIRQKLGLSKRRWKNHLRSMQRRGWLEDLNTLSISDKGMITALGLVRAHRLWETYLQQQVGLSEDQIHDEAERLEHLLTEEFLDQVDRELGYPTQDPHGSPIPPRA